MALLSNYLILGSSDASYSIGWSGLKQPRSGCAFEKVTITGGQYITGGASIIVGKKDKAVHIKARDDYIMQLKWIAKKCVILYDTHDRRAWLVDGASALLHLVRASLKHDLGDPFKSLFLYEDSALQESHCPHLGKVSAIDVLTNKHNMGLALYAQPEKNHEEATVDNKGARKTLTSTTKTNYCLKDRVQDIAGVLEQIIAHQADVSTQDGVGFKVKCTPRRDLVGFDFMDVATDEDPFWPRATTLRTSGRGWVDFSRAIHAITLFGSGFGALIQPTENAWNACAHCHVNSEVPKGQDYLTVCVSQMLEVVEKRGSRNTSPWRLIDDIYWHAPDKAFGPCQCSQFTGKKHDRVQVLLPTSFPNLWGRGLKSPVDLHLAQQGALLFGHSRKFPLKWSDHGTPEEGHSDQETEEMEAEFQDSGIGSSSMSGTTDEASRPSPSPALPQARSSSAVDNDDNECAPKRRKLLCQVPFLRSFGDKINSP